MFFPRTITHDIVMQYIHANIHAIVHWLAGIVNSLTGKMFNKHCTILTLASCHRVDPNIAITTCSVPIYPVFKLSPLLTDKLHRWSIMCKRCHLLCSIEMRQWWTPIGCMDIFHRPIVISPTNIKWYYIINSSKTMHSCKNNRTHKIVQQYIQWMYIRIIFLISPYPKRANIFQDSCENDGPT